MGPENRTGSNDIGARPDPDGGHLDEDAECLEDPVHAGDARHQHDLHEKAGTASDPAAADEAQGEARR